MNAESNLKVQRTQSNKSTTSYKRAHRAKRPVLVTGQESTPLSESPALAEEEEQSSGEVALAEKSVHSEEGEKKRGPRFFSSVDKTDQISDQPKADPIAARLARALRGKNADAPKEKETSKEKKGVPAPAKASSSAASTRPKSNFKMKYIWGMAGYLLIADFLGVGIQSWMQSQHLDAQVFAIGTFEAKRSTLIFLTLLIIILIVMARLDWIPRSLGAATGTSTSRKDAPKAGSKAPTFETKEARPTIKQGIKGADDELYREYRENQRYFQKRDRKR